MRPTFRGFGRGSGCQPGTKDVAEIGQTFGQTVAHTATRTVPMPDHGKKSKRATQLSRFGGVGALRRAAPWALSDRTGPNRLTQIMGNRRYGTYHNMITTPSSEEETP